MIKLEAALTNIYIIQVHFPTSKSSHEEMDVMYNNLEELLNLIEKKSNVFIIGNFNASIGEQASTSIHPGKYGLEKQNDRGALLLNFCIQMDMVIINTFYQVSARRRYTCKVPGDVRHYQIDFILVKRKYRNEVSLVTHILAAM